MEVQVSEADDQIAVVQEMVSQDGIPEVSLLDDEDDDQFFNLCQYPPSSTLSDPITDDLSSCSGESYDNNNCCLPHTK